MDEERAVTARVVVTGGCGFIGSHVVRALSKYGATVTALDSFQPSIPVDVMAAATAHDYRAAHLLRDAPVVQVDVADAEALQEHLVALDPTHVIHAAGVPLATTARSRPRQARDSILNGTFNVLEEAARSCPSLQRLVYVSSSMAYGHFSRPSMSETDSLRPVELYGGLKLAAEELVRCYSRMRQIPVTIVRPTSVYGPSDLNRRVIQVMLEDARAGREIQVLNPESTFLDFSYVTDVADGIVLATLNSEGMECTFNISYGSARSLADVTTLLLRIHPLATIVPRYEEDFRPRRGTLDTTLARELLGFSPHIDLETGLYQYSEFLEQADKNLRPTIP
jgi:UDP-glucose 4-epimerase